MKGRGELPMFEWGIRDNGNAYARRNLSKKLTTLIVYKLLLQNAKNHNSFKPYPI